MAKPQNGGKGAPVICAYEQRNSNESDFNCLAGDFGEGAAGFKIENYFTGA